MKHLNLYLIKYPLLQFVIILISYISIRISFIETSKLAHVKALRIEQKRLKKDKANKTYDSHDNYGTK